MAKPSIFSREYERRMKKRKRLVAVVVLLLVAVSGTFFAVKVKNINLFGFLNDKKAVQTEKKNEDIKNEDIKKEENDKKVKDESDKTSVKPAEEVPQELGYEVVLGDGSKIKAIYENINESKRFKYIAPVDAPVSFNINPSGTKLVISDNKAQKLLTIDINGTTLDITNQQYKSNKREAVLSSRPEYIWCASPKFIDNENIAYFSQLPYIFTKMTKKYLWVVNTNNKDNHINIFNINGENIKFGNIVEKGLETVLDDGSIKYIKFVDGVVKIDQ